MFFYLGNDCPLESLTQVENSLYLDQGWTNHNGIYYKGYSTDCRLSDFLNEILYEGFAPAGKWCVINGNKIYSPKLRGFPLYELNGALTNINFSGSRFISQDTSVPEEILESTISLDDAAYSIGNILLENTENFLKYNDLVNLRSLITCGLDSVTSWVVFDQVSLNYSIDFFIVNPNFAQFSEYQSDLISTMRKNLWSYNISRYYKQTNWLISGFYSERFQLREATNIDMISSYLNKDTFEYVKETDYLYWFLKKPRRTNHYKINSEKELKNECFKSIYHDYQAWHLDNNFQFSPFFDIRIPKIAYRLSLDDMIINLRNGVIQRKIIERFKPDALAILNDYKNSKNTYQNFRKNWASIKIDPSVKVSIFDSMLLNNNA